MTLKIEQDRFIDEEGRTVLFRGVNVSASSKVPFTPNGATHIKTDFKDHRDVSYVGRPFPLKEAHDHFKRLRHWGFNCLRFLVTWEAVEHKGPKHYDKEYLDYIEEILKIAESFGFYFFIDPHQDVWSRMSGGSGAPGWTFERAGLDFTKFDASEAAYLMQYRYYPNNPNTYLPMHWTANEHRFASATMFTLFFGGADFAPLLKIEGLSAQEYLQSHFFNAMKQVASRLKGNSHLLGFNTLNEPNSGFIEKLLDGSNIEGFKEILGYAFTPFDAMCTGAGYPRTIGYQEIKRFGIKKTREDVLNPNKVSAYLEGVEDIWQKQGVWALNENNVPVVLKNDYFVMRDGKKIDFVKEYLSPSLQKYAVALREIIPNTPIYFEGPFEKLLRGQELNFDLPEHVVNSSHWYDVATTGTKKAMLKANFNTKTGRPVVGKKNVQAMFIDHLASIKAFSKTIQGGVPTLIGEFGLAYDINNKSAYEKLKTEPETAWETHIKALTMYYNGMDANLLHCTQWHYTPDNTNELGDQWNLEDLSMFSKSQYTNPDDINSGGRAIKGFCRPHYVRCAGIPLKMEFNIKQGTFLFEFDGNASIKAPTTIYVPEIQFLNGFELKVSKGDVQIKEDEQLVLINIKENGIHTVHITKKN